MRTWTLTADDDIIYSDTHSVYPARSPFRVVTRSHHRGSEHVGVAPEGSVE